MNFLKNISFERLKNGLTKTKNNIVNRIQDVLNISSEIDETTYEKIEEILLTSDVGYSATQFVLNNAREKFKQIKNNSTEDFLKITKEQMLLMLLYDMKEENKVSYHNYKISSQSKPYVMMITGVNGTGKTTSIGKLAFHFKQNGYNVLIAAADTFRAAANEQLEIWAKRAEVEIFQQKSGSDPGAVVFEALTHAVKNKIDLVLIDTAGRLHTKSTLMSELKKIENVVEKKLRKKPEDVFLVIDASTGQNAIIQMNEFSKYVNTTGIILTKLDGTAKGGIIFQICHDKKIPVRYISVGEQIDDLQPFDPQSFVEALFTN